MTIDYPDFSSPYAIAGLLGEGSPSGTPGGIFLTNFPQLQLTVTSLVLSAGGNETYPASGYYGINQPSYQGALSISTSGAGPATFAVVLNWLIGSVLVAQDYFQMWAGSVASPHVVQFKGPTKGVQLQVVLENTSAFSITVNNFALYQDSRQAPYDIWRTCYNSGPSYPGAAVNGAIPSILAGNVIGYAAPALAASASETYALPLWTGRCVLLVATTSNTTNGQVVLNNAADILVPGNFVNGFTNSTGQLTLVDITLPRSQCTAEIINKAAANETMNLSLIAAEY